MDTHVHLSLVSWILSIIITHNPHILLIWSSGTFHAGLYGLPLPNLSLSLVVTSHLVLEVFARQLLLPVTVSPLTSVLAKLSQIPPTPEISSAIQTVIFLFLTFVNNFNEICVISCSLVPVLISPQMWSFNLLVLVVTYCKCHRNSFSILSKQKKYRWCEKKPKRTEAGQSRKKQCLRCSIVCRGIKSNVILGECSYAILYKSVIVCM